MSAARWRGRRQRKAPTPEDDTPADDAQAPDGYASYRVLLDSPAEHPGMGFGGYAKALAEVVVSSRAEFAVGIFGSWGAGKTTLMHAMMRELERRESVVCVWFAAWRYEREPSLILPLLDVLREALEKRAERVGKKGWAHDAAVEVSRAGLAFLAGLKLKAGLPGGVGVDLELGKTFEAIRADRKNAMPLSFYHEGYRKLGEAIEMLSAGGTRRVVIFIDDLDRCLPKNALAVLESMKLFFDVEGCVFVVGLDHKIAEKAVAVKYRSIARDETIEPGVSGPEYVKKIFQVAFTLPQITAGQLQDYLGTIERNGGFDAAQRQDFRDHVCPHLRQLQGLDPVNLREIKRLVNLYTTQLKILSRRLDESLNPNVVLALLCMNFRRDWEPFYKQLAADPEYFQETLRDAVEGTSAQPDLVYLAGTRYEFPGDLADYLGGRAAAVLHVENLQAYVSAAELTWTTETWVLEARIEVNRLRRSVTSLADGKMKILTDETVQMIRGHLGSLDSLIGIRHESSGPLGVLQEDLNAALGSLMTIVSELVDEQPTTNSATSMERWQAAIPQIDALDAGLLEWHRYVSLGP